MPASHSHSDSRFASLRKPLLLAALVAACAAPWITVQATPETHAISIGKTHRLSDSGEPYALVRQGARYNVTGGSDSKRVDALKGRISGDFLWFRSAGQEYIVQDPASLERAAAAWAPLEQMGEQMAVHGARMGRHGARMGSLGGDMAKAAVTLNKARMEAIGAQMEAEEKPMEALGKQMEVLGEQMEREQSAADRQMRAVLRDAQASGQARLLTAR